MIEDFRAILLSLLLFTIGFIAGNEYTAQKGIDREQANQLNFLMQQLPVLKNLHGS